VPVPAPVPVQADPRQTVPVAGAGYQGPASPPARRRPGGTAVGRWVAVIAGLVVLTVLASVLVPRLLAGPASAKTPSADGRRPAAGPSPARVSPAASPGRTAAPARKPAAPVTVPANAIPAWFAGTWSGTADQANGVVSRWTAVLVLPEGATTGRFTITSIPCSATVLVTDVSRIRLVLSETVNSNPAGQCAASGTISLHRTGLGRARLFWEESGNPANIATGAFART
jgi:hypothetical protein